MKSNKSVLVIGMTGVGLMPTTPRKARILIQAGKAKVHRKTPFTIRLLYKTGSATQETVLGIDTGSLFLEPTGRNHSKKKKRREKWQQENRSKKME